MSVQLRGVALCLPPPSTLPGYLGRAVHTASTARTLLTSDHGQNCPATRIKHDKHRFYGETIYKYLNIAIQDNISEVQMFATGYYLIRIRSTSVLHYININYLDITSFFMQMKSTERE